MGPIPMPPNIVPDGDRNALTAFCEVLRDERERLRDRHEVEEYLLVPASDLGAQKRKA